MDDFDFVDPLFDELLVEEFVLLVDVDDEDVAFLIGCVQLLLLVIPAHACEDRLVRIRELVMSFTFALRCLEPL